MDINTKLCKNPEILTRIIDANAVVIFLDDNDDTLNRDVYIFNDTGTRIWELINEGNTTQEIARKLSSEYDLPLKQAGAFVIKFAKKLSDKKLINNPN